MRSRSVIVFAHVVTFYFLWEFSGRVVSDARCHCCLRGACLRRVYLASLCRGDWCGACSVGRVWCRCAVGIRGHVVWVVCNVAVPSGLVGGASCAVGLGVWRVVFGCVGISGVVSSDEMSRHALACRVVREMSCYVVAWAAATPAKVVAELAGGIGLYRCGSVTPLCRWAWRGSGLSGESVASPYRGVGIRGRRVVSDAGITHRGGGRACR